MKKIILSLTALLSIAFVNAQSKSEGFSKGSIYVSGGFGFNSTNDKDTELKSSSYKFSPSAAYFVTSNLAVGAKLNFGGGSKDVQVNDTTTATTKNSTTGFGVFGRYYFTPASKFSVYANLGVDYNSTKPNTDDDFKENELGIAITPGINYFLSNHFSMEASYGRLGYTSTKSNVSGAKGTTSFGLDLDLSTISFGLNYKF